MRQILFVASLALSGCNDVTDQENLAARLAPGRGEVIWRVHEKTAQGAENRKCLKIPHDGFVVYWPTKRMISFTIGQNGQRKTLTGKFEQRPEHEVIFYWNQTSENVGLSVDGKPAKDFSVVSGTRPPMSCPF